MGGFLTQPARANYTFGQRGIDLQHDLADAVDDSAYGDPPLVVELVRVVDPEAKYEACAK